MRYLVTMLILVINMHLIAQDADVTVHELMITQFGYEAGLQSLDVTTLFQDSRGTFWVGTRTGGVFQFNQGRFVTIPELSKQINGEVTAICELPDGRVIFQTTSDLFAYDGRKVVTADMQVKSCVGAITAPAIKSEENVLCALEIGLGELWIGTNEGLRSFHPIDTLWQYYSDAFGLLDDPVQTVMYDHNNVLWIGTRTNGLLQYVGPVLQSADITLPTTMKITRYDPAQDQVVLQCEDNRLYSINQADGLNHIRGFDSTEIKNYFIDGYGHYWLAGADEKVRIMDVNSPDSIISTVDLKNSVKGFTYDRFNTVWIETEGKKLYSANASAGLSQYQFINLYAKLPDDKLVDLIARGGNQVYRIGQESVGIIRNNKYVNLYKSNTPILCAHVEASGIVWVGTVRNGVIKLEEGKQPRNIELPIPWHVSNIYFLHKKESILWVGTSNSVFQYSLDHTERSVLRSTRVLNMPHALLKARHYTAMADQSICVISGDAVYLLKQQGFIPTGSKPRVFLSSVNLRDKALSESQYQSATGAYAKQIEPLSLSYSENTLTFSWEGLSMIPGTLTYSYRLSPEGIWSVASSRTALQLSGLDPGNYLFDIQVCDENGNCSTLESPWQFEIRTALWQHRWFWLIIAMVALVGVTFGIKFREKKIREKAERHLKSVKSKLHTIELEQKAMQLQMNPHFIFNAIQTIHHQLLNNKVNKAANSLVSFSTLMRSMLEMSRTEKISLEDELDFLNAYVRVEQICRPEKIDFTIDVNNEVEPFDTMIPSMMLQPIIENAIIHGGPRITLHINSRGKYLNLKVCDNGPGFSDDLFSDGKSIALTLLRERVVHMPGNGFVRYKNIVENGEVMGACVDINVPEPVQYS